MEHEAVRELAAAYALDALDPDDERAFEAHLARCPACREELSSFQEVAAVLAHDVEAPAPPPALRARILDRARAERPNVVPLRRRWALPAAAAVAAVAASAAIGLGIWAASLSGELSSEREASKERAGLVAILSDPGAQRVPVVDVRGGAVVVSSSGRAALVLPAIDRAPAGRTYQAWVIEEGTPKPAGIFPGGAGTVLELGEPVGPGTVVAVTLEPAGGLPAPSGEPLFTAEIT